MKQALKSFGTKVAALSLALPVAVMAQTPTPPSSVADLVAQVKFTDVVAAIFAIGLLVIAVDLAMLGYMKVRRLVKGAH